MLSSAMKNRAICSSRPGFLHGISITGSYCIVLPRNAAVQHQKITNMCIVCANYPYSTNGAYADRCVSGLVMLALLWASKLIIGHVDHKGCSSVLQSRKSMPTRGHNWACQVILESHNPTSGSIRIQSLKKGLSINNSSSVDHLATMSNMC